MSEDYGISNDGGFHLVHMVQAQRGLSPREIEIFLATGRKPDLSQPPPEELERIDGDTQVMPLEDAAAWLSGGALTASSFFDFDSSHSVSPLYEVVRPKVESLRFDPHQPRDGDGKWTDGPLGGVGTLIKKTAASTKKVTPAVIYKKHDDGAVVGHSASGQRMRWDAGRKKFVVEKEKSGSWVEESAHTKTSAYNEMKNPDKWFEPAETGTENEPSSPSLTPEPDLADTELPEEKAPEAPAILEPEKVTSEETSQDGYPTPTPVPEVDPDWPFSFEPFQEPQMDYGHLVRSDDDAYKNDPNHDYELKTLPVSTIVPSQENDYEEWGDGLDNDMTGKPLAIKKDGNLYLMDGHHRTVKAGENGSIQAWVLDLDKPKETAKTDAPEIPQQADAPAVESISSPLWKPTMTEAEAKDFTADSVVKTPLFHGTAYGDDIRENGFQVEKLGTAGGVGGLVGAGHYLTGLESDAKGYAGNGEVLRVAARVTNPVDITSRDAVRSEILKQAMFRKSRGKDVGDAWLDGKSGQDGFENETRRDLLPNDWEQLYDDYADIRASHGAQWPSFVQTKWLQDHGYDGAIWHDEDGSVKELAVFDDKAVTVIGTPDTEIPKQAEAPTIESITPPSTYVGPTIDDYAGAPKDVIDKVRAAYLADYLHTQRVEDRADVLRADKEKYSGYGAWDKSIQDARAELGWGPPVSDLDNALDALTKALPDYNVRDNIRRRISLEATNERMLSVFAEKNNLGEVTPELKADLARRAKDAFADKKVAVRVTPKVVEYILNDGRLKSQFESGKSKGKNDIDMRASIEHLLFGVSDKPWQNPEKRPIYGYVAVDGIRPVGIGSAQLGDPSTDQLTQYGQVQVVLKDSVRSRTTAMFGDSLNNMNEGVPSPVDDPDWKSFTASRGGVTGKGLEGLDRSGDSAEFRAGSYAEAQIHGGISVDDIEEIVFPSNPTATVKKQLEDAGIPYRVLTFKTAADGSDEDRANALRIAKQDKAHIKTAIAAIDEKIAKYPDESEYKKDREKYVKQLKVIDDALPLLEGTKTSSAKKVAAAKEKVAKAIAPKQTKTHAVNPGGEDSFLDEDQKFDSWAARLTTRAKELAPVLAQFKQEDRGGGNSVWDVPSNGSDEDIMRKWLGAWQGSSNTPAVKDLARAAKELTGKDAPTGTYASSNPDVPKAIARAIYDQTQNQLADAGVSHVRLYRGLKTQDYTHDGSGTFESWTSDRSIAENFAMGEGVSGSTDHTKSGTVLTMDVPAADIFSTSKSGMGTDYEREYVVIPDKNLGPTIEVVSPKTVIPKQAEAPKIESTSTGTKLSAAEEQELTSLQAGIADLYGQSGYWRMLAAEVTHKNGTGKLLTPQDMKDSDQAHAELKKLRDAATPLAERALELRMKRDGDLFGDVEDVNADRWASKAEPSAVMLPGNDKAKIDKIADSYRVNDKQTTEHNMSLRSDDPAQAALSWRSRMKRMINSQQMTRDAVVYRGAALTPERLMQLRPGTVMIDPGSMSTDESRGTAEFYMNVRLNDLPGTLATVFEIRAPKGIPVADVDFGEYVFDFETPMRIISTTRVNGVVNVVAELVPPAEAKALYGTAKPTKPKASSVPSVNLNAGKKGSISAKDAKRVQEINFAKPGILPDSPPQEIYDKAKSTAYYNNWSIMQVLEAIDAMQPGYKKTVLDWVKTPEGSAYVDKKPSTS